MSEYIVPFESVGRDDIETVGGKNASLGEMIGALSEEGIDVPGGFAITAAVSWPTTASVSVSTGRSTGWTWTTSARSGVPEPTSAAGSRRLRFPMR
jgi:hypothetical protein